MYVHDIKGLILMSQGRLVRSYSKNRDSITRAGDQRGEVMKNQEWQRKTS